jgi:hypothetical protein
MNTPPKAPHVLNQETVQDLIGQTDIMLAKTLVGTPEMEAWEALKVALVKVQPFLPVTDTHQIDEAALEDVIRDEIVIAGANENG